jgi:hypothetical protein
VSAKPHVVHVGELVADRHGVYRWAVSATFVGVAGGQARCIEYRVRVVPTDKSAQLGATPIERDNWANAHAIESELEADNSRKRRKLWHEAEADAPAEGIPRWVFERASQARMLAKARDLVRDQPDRFQDETVRLLEMENGPRRGRPPIRSLEEKLRILAAVETGFAEGKTIGDIATEQGLSRSSLRDLLAWARSTDSGTVLFTGSGPGKRGGHLTPAARSMLEQGHE